MPVDNLSPVSTPPSLHQHAHAHTHAKHPHAQTRDQCHFLPAPLHLTFGAAAAVLDLPYAPILYMLDIFTN